MREGVPNQVKTRHPRNPLVDLILVSQLQFSPPFNLLRSGISTTSFFIQILYQYDEDYLLLLCKLKLLRPHFSEIKKRERKVSVRNPFPPPLFLRWIFFSCLIEMRYSSHLGTVDPNLIALWGF
jgi:hypothetical protein